MNRSYAKYGVIALWVGAIGGWFWHLQSSGSSPTDSMQAVVDAARGAWWAPLLYIAAYAARPLLLFPASIITIAGGILFGPWWGTLIVVIASNLSAMIAYHVGRSLTSPPGGDGSSTTLMARWSRRMEQESFLTVMVMRLAFLPYDLVNYACGFLRIRPGAFLAATAIGSFPGTLSFVLAGASIERIDDGLSGFDPKVFVASVVLFVVSLFVAKALQRRNDTAAVVVDAEALS